MDKKDILDRLENVYRRLEEAKYSYSMYEVKALEMTILSTKATISAIYRDFLPNIVARAAYR